MSVAMQSNFQYLKVIFIKYQFPKPSLFSSASNCSASCPSVDTFSKFRAQADLTVTPPGSNDVDPSIFNSFPGGYFSVKPTEEFWLNPGDFLGFSGTGVAGGIGYRWQCSQKYFRQMHFFSAIARCSKPITMMAGTKLKRRRAQ